MESDAYKRHEELIKQSRPVLDKAEDNEVGKEKSSFSNWEYALLVGLFIAAFAARLYFIFFVSNPDNPGAGWFGDAYHHWQIAYLSKEIGFDQGLLRLWDLKGMEFFWGLLHPIFTIFAFVITGSVSIAVERGMTAFFGSISVCLTYLIVKKHWSIKAAIPAAIFVAINPVGVFNDASGMVEPIGIPFLLLGIYFWPQRAFLSGFSLFIALMARAEYWVFSAGIIFAMVTFFPRVKVEKRVMAALGYGIPLLAYMKYLLNYTNNPIYPFYWNYVTNIYGTWQLKEKLTSADIFAKYLFLGIFIISVAVTIYVIVKRPKGLLVYLLGLGNWMFLGASFGLGQYIKSYATYVWYVRFMILPYIFVGILIALFLFHFLPHSKLKLLDKLKINYLIFLAILIAIQPVWYLIWDRFSITQPVWESSLELANSVAAKYEGGGLLLVEGNPDLTYALVKIGVVEGKDIVSQMFDPYYYFEGDIYENWEDNRLLVLDFLKKNNIQTIVSYVQYERYMKLQENEPEYISEPYYVPDTNIVIYQVDDKLYETEEI